MYLKYTPYTCLKCSKLFLAYPSHKRKFCSIECKITFQNISIEERFFKFVHKTDTCWIWTGCKGSSFGHGQFHLNGKMESAHRISWNIHFGDIPEGMHICHHCDNPPLNPDHLFIGTAKDNMHDKMNKGRSNTLHGEAHASSILSEKEVLEIKSQLSDDPPYGTKAQLARQYGVSPSTIQDIAKGRCWK